MVPGAAQTVVSKQMTPCLERADVLAWEAGEEERDHFRGKGYHGDANITLAKEGLSARVVCVLRGVHSAMSRSERIPSSGDGR